MLNKLIHTNYVVSLIPGEIHIYSWYIYRSNALICYHTCSSYFASSGEHIKYLSFSRKLRQNYA